MRHKFIIYLILIALLGFGLRLIDYTQVPVKGETKDEFMYPWAGMSLLKTGVPTSWSNFDAYKNFQKVKIWGEEYRLVTPWFDKPLLYPLIAGSLMLATGATTFDQVNLSILRLIPIILSCLSIFLLGLITRKIFQEKIALLASLLYTIIPTFVLSSRLSLVENLLIPLSLSAIYLLQDKLNTKKTIYLGIICGLGLLTKQIGIWIYFSAALILFLNKQYKHLFYLTAIFAIFAGIFFLSLITYDLSLYLKVMSNFRIAHALSGLPELLTSIFRFPGISQKSQPFLDGSILLGLILLLSSPLWLKPSKPNLNILSEQSIKNQSLALTDKKLSFMFFPFLYLLFLSAVESSAPAYGYFGWHIYPIFPFLAIVLAKFFMEIYQNLDIPKLILLIFTIGASSIRFIFLTLPREALYRWQYLYFGLIIVFVLVFFMKNKLQKKALLGLFAVYLLINIYTVINLKIIYPSIPPLP